MVVCEEFPLDRYPGKSRAKCRLLRSEDRAFGAKPGPSAAPNSFRGERGTGEQGGRGKGRGEGGGGRGGNTATLKAFFSAKTGKRYYRIHTSVPPNPQTRTRAKVPTQFRGFSPQNKCIMLEVSRVLFALSFPEGEEVRKEEVQEFQKEEEEQKESGSDRQQVNHDTL